MKPFLKWAGSKYKIIDTIVSALPQGNRLIEPFVGSGAVFLNTHYQETIASDVNPDLINLFNLVKSEGEVFIAYAAAFFTLANNTEKEYYALRELFNETSDISLKSALFIYLNRHCFNGLCRYNSKGKFNVPFGRYKSPSFPAAEMQAFAERSQSVTFVCQDFRAALAQVRAGDVVYCDPPYAPLEQADSFTSYSENGFNKNDQEDLAKLAEAINAKNIPVIISNHDTQFTRLAYHKAKIKSFSVQRYIASKAVNRIKAAELLATYA